MWIIQKIVSKGEYNYAVVPEHPNATSNGYVLEHRVVMENAIGRCGSEFARRANQRAEVKKYKNAFCSRSCNGKFQRRKQLS